MSQNPGKEELLRKLEQLLRRKQSKTFYANRLGISLEEVENLLTFIRTEEGTTSSSHSSYPRTSSTNLTITEDTEYYYHYNTDKETLESKLTVDFNPTSVEELAKLHKIDTTKYKISHYWSKLKSDGKFTSSVLASKIADNVEDFQNKFIEFLQNYNYSSPNLHREKEKTTPDKKSIGLIIPKQDAHFNKRDFYGDKNDIDDRFREINTATLKILKKASQFNVIEDILYIIGSDQFNSEWTNATTKGTPQSNILSYQASFKKICDNEIGMILDLLRWGNKVNVVFVPGNHDEYVGWHLIHFLSSYFRYDDRVKFDLGEENTKYFKFRNSAIMLNHGDVMKPKELAHRFPIGFKDEWSKCDHYYIFTGDKHHELSMDIHGIRFYQLPQLSKARSKWDDKQGYNCDRAELQVFVITEDKGISDIYKEIL